MPSENHPRTAQDWSDFELYLRKGLRRTVSQSAFPERKFNPWHDPDDGRFTFAGTGEYHMGRKPTGGYGGFAGGGFGGGGASGSWEPDPPARKKPQPRRPARVRALPKKPPRPHGRWDVVEPEAATPAGESLPPAPAPEHPQPAASRPALANGSPSAKEKRYKVQKNGYNFELDGIARTRKVAGTLHFPPKVERSRRNQAEAGGADRLAGDDGGHYIAARFHGPKERFNHFAQDANFNRGAYRTLESVWAKDIARGYKVNVTIQPQYDGHSKRPSKILVKWVGSAGATSRSFRNRRGEL